MKNISNILFKNLHRPFSSKLIASEAKGSGAKEEKIVPHANHKGAFDAIIKGEYKDTVDGKKFSEALKKATDSQLGEESAHTGNKTKGDAVTVAFEAFTKAVFPAEHNTPEDAVKTIKDASEALVQCNEIATIAKEAGLTQTSQKDILKAILPEATRKIACNDRIDNKTVKDLLTQDPKVAASGGISKWVWIGGGISLMCITAAILFLALGGGDSIAPQPDQQQTAAAAA